MTNIMIIQYNIYISFSFGPWLKTWYEAYHIWFRDNIATASFACMRSCVVANLASLYPAVFASHELLTRFTPISTMITLWCPAIHPRPGMHELSTPTAWYTGHEPRHIYMFASSQLTTLLFLTVHIVHVMQMNLLIFLYPIFSKTYYNTFTGESIARVAMMLNSLSIHMLLANVHSNMAWQINSSSRLHLPHSPSSLSLYDRFCFSLSFTTKYPLQVL